MGWGGGGLLTKKMEQGKRNKIVIAFDIIVIIIFIWFAMTQRFAYEQGYNSCFTQICSNPLEAGTICSNIAKARNMSIPKPIFCNDSFEICPI